MPPACWHAEAAAKFEHGSSNDGRLADHLFAAGELHCDSYRCHPTLMTREPSPSPDAGTAQDRPVVNGPGRLGFVSLLFLSAWCGLVAGLLEVGTIVRQQAHRRSQSALWHEPALRLAHPADEPGRFPGRGIIRRHGESGLAAPRAAACRDGLVRAPVAADRLGLLSADLWSGLARGCAGGWGPARSGLRAECRAFSGGSCGPVSRWLLGTVAILGASPWVGDRHQAVA